MYLISKEIKFILKDENICENLWFFFFYSEITQVFWRSFSLQHFQSAKFITFRRDHCLKHTSIVLAFLLFWLVFWVQAARSALISAENHICFRLPVKTCSWQASRTDTRLEGIILAVCHGAEDSAFDSYRKNTIEIFSF